MKRTLLLLACGLLAFASCKKSNIDPFRGDYSFKTSGNVTVQRQATILDTVPPAVFTVSVPNDLGQLEISTLDKENDSVVVIMNILNDEVIVAHGCCKDDELVMQDFKRNALYLNVDYEFNLRAPVNIKAKGRLYDDNTLVFEMTYHGTATVGDLIYNIHGDDIKMVAYRN
ncbi:MAG: hypothetical protein IKT08_08065 [Bacteroidales bacterium]|nr:hypothetical protein [Bacteroidales bacterium]